MCLKAQNNIAAKCRKASPEVRSPELRFAAPGQFYKKESQEKTLLQRPDFFLLRSPLD
jgi:hypothetical protein